jgi:3-oxoacyl-[acyl-carrier protein] reductase
MSISLDGRVALVTGSTRGIGFAIAKALHTAGARVAILARDQGKADEVAAGLGAETALGVAADVTDAASVAAAVERVVAWGGRLDILVNSAGPQLTPQPLADTETAVLENYLNVKLLGFHRMAAAAAPHLSEDGTGRVINIVGQTAITHVPNAGVTGITNAGVLAFSKYLAAELAPRGILVNAISPGLTLTEGWLGRHEAMAQQAGKTPDEVRDGMTAASGIKLGRWAEPEEIGKAAVFLASDLASYVSGSVLEVDGGWSKAIV